MTKAEIFYKDIGDYLSREEKLKIVSEGKSILNPDLGMGKLNPNEHGDWINKRNSLFDDYIPIEPNIKFDVLSQSFFNVHSLGINTNRDAWVYNSSKNVLEKNMKTHVSFYNSQVEKMEELLKKNEKINIETSKDNPPDKISWSSSLVDNLRRFKTAKYEKDKIHIAAYRPFYKQYIYTGDKMIHRRGQFEQFFPNNEKNNLIICVAGVGATKPFDVYITDLLPDIQLQANGQCFPLYWYEKKNKVQGGLFEKTEDEYTRHDAISDFILEQAKSRYGPRVSKEDIFYYVYGILHSPDYRKTFANDLKKMLPRLPLIEKVQDFWVFAEAGRKLADIHINYEEQEPPKELLINGKPLPKSPFPNTQLIVNKMKFPSKDQKDTIIFNSHLTLTNIPEKAYEYIVNGKSAIEWVMERYQISTHKESGITNDPNDWAMEHNDPQYILNLLLSVISVSMNTVDIVAALPKVEWG